MGVYVYVIYVHLVCVKIKGPVGVTLSVYNYAEIIL